MSPDGLGAEQGVSGPRGSGVAGAAAFGAEVPDGGLPAAEGSDEQPVLWRNLLAETVGRLAESGIDAPSQEARWIVERASGLDGTALLAGLDGAATSRSVAHLDAMIARRCAGEPVQYVLGRWGFRTLDLLCDRRALIPRPETEQVVDVALAELERVLRHRPDGHRALAVDLGTGTGAVALSLAVERPGIDVWAVDRSPGAVAVARANLAGLGMAGTRVRLAEGSWFEPLPDRLRGHVDLVVTNPPYVATHEDLPASVADWEPTEALVAGPTGLEAFGSLVTGAASWLAPGGAFVTETGATQATEVVALALAAGLVDCRVEPDHAGHDRTVVAHRPT